MDSRAIIIRDDSEADLNELQTIRDTWDEREAMAVSRITDSISSKTRSRVTGSQLATLALEGSARTMAQLGTGQVKALSADDKGTAILLDIVLQRYIIPNDRNPYDHLVKLRMLDFYSRIYGTMPMIYDYEVSPCYTGPVSELIPVRDWIPQRGRISPRVSDYNHVDSWVSSGWLSLQIKPDDTQWNKREVKKLLKIVENEGRQARKEQTRESSYVERVRDNSQSLGSGKNIKIRLRTRYESGEEGRWITVAPDYGYLVLRDIPNPHDNGKIPVITKYNIPLIDSAFGLSDFERGKSIQLAMDSLTNLTLDSIKMKLYPPMIVNPNGVVPASLTYAPGKRWLETVPNSIRAYEVSPTSLNHFQSVHSFLSGLLLNQNGTTNTMFSAEDTSNPAFGKTPQALKMLFARENTRDAMDRFFMEQAIEDLYDGFLSLVVNNQTSPINLHLFDKEVENLISLGYEDLNKRLKISGRGDYATLTVDKNAFKNKEYKFYVDAGSTQRKDDQTQVESLLSILTIITKMPQINEMLATSGKKIEIDRIITQIIAKSGIESPEKIITDLSPQEMPQQTPQPPPVPPDTPEELDPYWQAALGSQQPSQGLEEVVS